MNTTSLNVYENKTQMLEIATFYLGDLLLGIDIHQIQEINRNIDITEVPHAPEYVQGVINLRGEVVTVIDLCQILKVERTVELSDCRNIIVNSSGEHIGLLVDKIADVVNVRSDEIDPPLANLHGIDGRFFDGVYRMESELMVLLNVDEILTVH